MTKIGDEAWNQDLAKRYKICMIYGKYHVKTAAGEHDANIAEQVARAKGHDGDLAFENEVRVFLYSVERSNQYTQLYYGNATPELILNTLTWYAYVRKCR